MTTNCIKKCEIFCRFIVMGFRKDGLVATMSYDRELEIAQIEGETLVTRSIVKGTVITRNYIVHLSFVD